MNNLQKTAKELKIRSLINDGGKAAFASIIAVVSHSMIKTNKETNEINPLWHVKDLVTKKTKYQILLNSIYTNRVNNQREKEGKETDFVAKENWHVKVFDGINGSLVKNRKDLTDSPELYLLFSQGGKAETFEYYIDGKIASIDEVNTIKKFTPIRTATNQGLNEIIVVNTVKLSNIIELNAFGETLNWD